MAIIVIFAMFLLATGFVHSSILGLDPKNHKVDLSLLSASGKNYNLKLSKADESVLHPNVQVITINNDLRAEGSLKSTKKQSSISGNVWAPTKQDVEDLQNIYIDSKSQAVVRLVYDKLNQKYTPVSGLVGGNSIKSNGTEALILDNNTAHPNQSDYRKIPNEEILSQSKSRQLGDGDGYEPTRTVEVILVCDKEFGDLFDQDHKRILDYWTVYFWDVNMRFKTLPSTQISFRINAVIVMATTEAQPFIEESRGPNGRTEFGRILGQFSPWVYENMGALPKFDMAIAVTYTYLEWAGGLAWMRGACGVDHGRKTHWGTLVFNDGGDFGSVTTGAHEIAHNIGAPHDDEPKWGGYIMNGGYDHLRWFFSPKSDQNIADFVQNGATCLRIFDQKTSEIPSDFSGVEVPTMQEQCRKKLNNPDVYVNPQDTADCSKMICKLNGPPGYVTWWTLPTLVDNTPCLNGRCFRGRCIKLGKMLVNVGTNLCAKLNHPPNTWTWTPWTGQLQLVSCPSIQGATPLDQFVIEEVPNGNRLYFQTPSNSADGNEHGERCLYTANGEGNWINADKCSFDNPWHGWDMVIVGSNGEFLLKHKVSGRCAKPDKNDVGHVATYSACIAEDRDYRWRLV